eukprot:CAMPEP_0179062136 /NCGR_PEP_ID=MMETSP0796-20121207/26777_1 /TAXON_ID=73915 /ORGANISM="Pyrodinium bahamense, Strain pbaha01" /LENGTH=51 /DNA_ID=CAMNT_0020759043 /DNA_START=453 /DNA_END=608 /DNA_ORIENTATION=+
MTPHAWRRACGNAAVDELLLRGEEHAWICRRVRFAQNWLPRKALLRVSVLM